MRFTDYLKNAAGHMSTVGRHRRLVRKYCFRMGLYRQGLTHDLSKYSPTEFSSGIKYYQGTRSPNAQERQELGYSTAWMHHKGRNPHHFEYWTDCSLESHLYEPLDMPNRYFAEMIADRIAASQTYLGERYTSEAPLAYHNRSKESRQMNPCTVLKLEFILGLISESGEDTALQFLKRVCSENLQFDAWTDILTEIQRKQSYTATDER